MSEGAPDSRDARRQKTMEGLQEIARAHETVALLAEGTRDFRERSPAVKAYTSVMGYIARARTDGIPKDVFDPTELLRELDNHPDVQSYQRLLAKMDAITKKYGL